VQEKAPEATVEIYPNVKDLAAIQFIICWKPKKGILSQFPNVKVLQSLGSGVNHIFRENTIPPEAVITRIVDKNLTRDMWEFTLTVVLTQMRRLPLYAKNQERRIWKPRSYRRMRDTTVAVLGLGKIGGYVAEQFAALGFKVKGWSNSKKNIPKVESYAGLDELPTCLKEVDYLISILPLTPATTGILNKENLQHLKKGAFILNVGRGPHQNETDLIALLDSGHLSGVLLDVFATEPLPSKHPFWTHPKIQITPHVASLTDLNSASDLIVENYRRLKVGEDLLNVVSLDKGY